MVEKKKPGKPLRFPARQVVFMTDDMKAGLERIATARSLQVPDVIRAFVREGLERAALQEWEEGGR